MIKSKMQHELISRGVTYKGYALLNYLIDNLFMDFKGADLQKLRPMFFKDAKCVKQAFDELENAEIIKGQYKSGNVFDIQPNRELIVSLSDISSGIKIEKKEVKKSSKKSDIDEAHLDIVKCYNSYATLPRPSTFTPLAKARLEEKLELYSPEQIKEAFGFASKQSWLINKGSEKWCNMAWVIGNIDGFMIGGKYRKSDTSSVKEEESIATKYGLDSSSTIIF